MDTARREMIWVGGLWVCVLAVVVGARAGEYDSVEVEPELAESAVILLGDVSPDRMIPLPDTYTVKRRYPDGHPLQNALAGGMEILQVIGMTNRILLSVLKKRCRFPPPLAAARGVRSSA